MIRVALRGLAGRKLRATLTAFAIILGVAMVSGTYVLTDTIDKAFDNIFSETYANTDAVVSGKTADISFEGDSADTPPVDQSVLPQIRALPDVESAAGAVIDDTNTKILKKDGDAVNTNGAPSFGFGLDPALPQFNPLKLLEGKWPTGPDEVVIDAATADEQGYKVGDSIKIATLKPVRSFDLVGLAQYGDVASIGSATFTVFSIPTAQVLLDRVGTYDTISVDGKEGVTQQALADEIKPILPPTAQVRTADAQAKEDAKDVSFTKFIRYFLLSFAGVALFVGAFVIFNILSITVAQRVREFATIRTIGGSRKQILWSVVLEAFVIGLVASRDRVVRGSRARRGTERALQGDQRRPADPGARLRAADRDRVAADRRRRHGHRRPHPGRTGHARTADRGGARRLGAPEVALLEVRALHRDRGHRALGHAPRVLALQGQARHRAAPDLDGRRGAAPLRGRRDGLLANRAAARGRHEPDREVGGRPLLHPRVPVHAELLADALGGVRDRNEEAADGAPRVGGDPGRPVVLAALLLSTFLGILIAAILLGTDFAVLTMWVLRKVRGFQPEWPVEFPNVRPEGMVNDVAKENSRRNPGRTASTAAALMIGIALVTFVAVLASGMKKSNRGAIEDQVKAEYVVTAQDGFSPFVAEAGEAVQQSPDAQFVTSVRSDLSEADGESGYVTGIQPGAIAQAYHFDWKEGSDAVLGQLGRNGAIISDDLADKKDLAVGDTFVLLTPNGKQTELVVKGIYSPPPFFPMLGNVSIPQTLFDSIIDRPRNSFVFVNVPGEPTDATTASLKAAVKDFPDSEGADAGRLDRPAGRGLQQLPELPLHHAGALRDHLARRDGDHAPPVGARADA